MIESKTASVQFIESNGGCKVLMLLAHE